MMRPRPQRLAPPSPPGTLFKRTIVAGRKARIETPADPAYLALIRELPCLKCGMSPCGEAAHVRITSAAFNKRGGMRKKPDDKWAVPLDGGCHREDRDALHRMGEYLFWQGLGINPLLVCERLYAQRDDFPAMQAIIYSAMAERSK